MNSLCHAPAPLICFERLDRFPRLAELLLLLHTMQSECARKLGPIRISKNESGERQVSGALLFRCYSLCRRVCANGAQRYYSAVALIAQARVEFRLQSREP